MQTQLPQEFTHLVDWSVTELGKVIEFEIGKVAFKRIERIRRYVKSPAASSLAGLVRLKQDLERLSAKEQYDIAHAFALMLELINSCEAAYRTYRLKSEDYDIENVKHSYGRIIHVLTAHPTESRNSDIIYYFKKIQKLLDRRLTKTSLADDEELNNLLKLAWHIPMSKQRKPTVMDEAEYIYSLALEDDIIELFIKQRLAKYPFYIRTWVGGDKDGHPGVDEKTMLASLNMARKYLLRWFERSYEDFLKDLKPALNSSNRNNRLLIGFNRDAKKLKIRQIQTQDAKRLHRLKLELDKLAFRYRKVFGVDAVGLHRLQVLLKIFPGLVVPLELREDSSLVHEALQNPRKPFNISRMLKTLARISPDHDPRFYVRGFVLSNTESAKDIEAGLHLSKKYLKQPRLPIVPLFESAHSLENCTAIMRDFLRVQKNRNTAAKYWSKQQEVMLGYSDSAKENGSFASRFLIQSAVGALEKEIGKHDLSPVFFHGSGGSIERGGGSVQEQTAWWPLSALQTVKVTVQGEMIYRNYTAAEILSRQLERFMQARDQQAHKKVKPVSAKTTKLLAAMAHATKASYQETLSDSSFLEMIELATPYSYLKDLRMGSRPAKRQGPVQLKSLRAIPWVLCWTQTRALFPSWWGVGKYWKSLAKSEKAAFKKAFKESPLFSSYVKALGFTLEKIELHVFALYLKNSKLPVDLQDRYIKAFEREFSDCRKCVREITGEKNLLWYRPWLATSISLRSPLIHPLNILQLIALKEKDLLLLRESVTGVASGMLTTG